MFRFKRDGIEYDFAPLPELTGDEILALIPEYKGRAHVDAPAPAPAPISVDIPNTGLHARVIKQDLLSMNTEYKNGTPSTATFKIRVGTVDRPNRVVLPGKTVVSTYTTTVKTGFTGQKITVMHLESGTILLEQVL